MGHDKTDSDGISTPSPYEQFYMEKEGYNTVNKWWRARFGSGPPILSDANTRNLPGIIDAIAGGYDPDLDFECDLSE